MKLGMSKLFYFTIPRLLIIKDIRLGIANKIVQLGIFIFIFVNLFYFETYYETEIPSGYITSMWAETGDLYTSQRAYSNKIDNNLSLGYHQYCDSPQYNYIFSLPYWDYRNLSCINLPYSEMYEKGEQEFFFMTMFTENSIDLFDCEHPEFIHTLPDFNGKVDGVDNNKSVVPINNTTIRNQTDIKCDVYDKLDGNCICQNYRNFYTVGAEDMYFVFDYKYVTTFQKGGNYVDSSSKSVTTRIFDANNKMVNQYESGTNIKLSVGEWLRLSNTNLSGYNGATKLSEPGTGVSNLTNPIFRITGVELVFKISCNNLVQDTKEDYGVTLCDITPEVNEGWSSKGSSITYIEYPDLNDKFIKSYYKDRYRYGIKINFYFTGKIGKFNYNNMINTIISGLVLIGTGATIIILIISNFCCGYTKKIMDESNEAAHNVEFMSWTSCRDKPRNEEDISSISNDNNIESPSSNNPENNPEDNPEGVLKQRNRLHIKYSTHLEKGMMISSV
jgi:hypothetical protein